MVEINMWLLLSSLHYNSSHYHPFTKTASVWFDVKYSLDKTIVTVCGPWGRVYRVYTMITARNHQPVNIPVAQRGTQDDYSKFEVVAAQGGNGSAGAGNSGKGGKNAENANIGKMATGKVDGKAQDQNLA